MAYKGKHGTFSPADGFVPEFDIKEDEEQSVKLNQTVDLLLAAGYFRARIKGLSPFDKIVGGMTWCITTCNIDIDVDLLFQENSTIGQKIALTEKIVAVLPKMKCPHRIEPHQIQGLDFIHIFPVIQWLVTRAIETRAEMGDYIRAYSVFQFDRHHKMPEDVLLEEQKPQTLDTLDKVQNIYQPTRKYKRHDCSEIYEEELRVQSTLLEYGKHLLRNKSKISKDEDKKVRKSRTGRSESLTEEEEEARAAEEEKQISSLMSGMTLADKQGSRITTNTVGSIVGMQSEQIQQIASQYAEKQAELGNLEKSSPKLSGMQQHKRSVGSLQKQIQQKQSKVNDFQKKHDELHETTSDIQTKLQSAEDLSSKIGREMDIFVDMETDENKEVLQKLRDLIATNEKLKKQEQEFRTQCKQEKERLESEIQKLANDSGLTDDDPERNQLIDRQYEADKLKLNKIRLVLAKRNREISALQRKIDEVPSRAELSQYQRRFVELYNQIATKHKETKQFYTLHNTLDDTKLYLDKEIKLLNSIHDTFEQAMSSTSAMEQFMKQFEQIVEGVSKNRVRLEKKKQEEKMRRDQMNDQHIDLVEKQRLYSKTVKDFQEECRKNEILLAKLNV